MNGMLFSKNGLLDMNFLFLRFTKNMGILAPMNHFFP